jgi:hypothetical protein
MWLDDEVKACVPENILGHVEICGFESEASLSGEWPLA